MDGLAPQTPGHDARDLDDIDQIRQRTLEGVVSAMSSFKPVESGGRVLALKDVQVGKAPDLSYKSHKEALLGRGTIGTPVHGTWVLTDKASGQVLDEKKKLLALVPTVTKHGTYVRRGIEYTVANQQRLRPGVFTHRKGNGEIESHFNVAPGTGKQFRLQFEPESGRFFVKAGQANLPLVPLLRAMGADDQSLKQRLGEQIYRANTDKLRADVVQKAVKAFGVRRDPADARPDEQLLAETLAAAKLDPDAVRRTLIGKPYDRVTPEALLDATEKLLQLHRGEVEPDNRDSLRFQRIFSHEDLFPERVKNDAGGVIKRMAWKIARRGTLDQMPAGVFNAHMDQVILGSGLGQPPEETNPTEIVDQLMRVSRLGEGAIADTSAVPDEARTVQGSYAGWIDPIRSPESEKVGIDNRFAYGVKKGRDGQLYTTMRNVRTGQEETVSADAAGDAVVALPGELDKTDDDRVVAVVNGNIKRVRREQVDYEIPSSQQMFTMQTNLMPGLGAVSGGRVFLGAKFVSQALPLKNREAPLVRAADPTGEKAFETHFGNRLGTVKSDLDGIVTNVTADEIEVQGPNGRKAYSIANYLPYNRKTFLKHHARVKVGDQVRNGDMLAVSNMTDDKGDLALGTNLKIAYVPFDRGGGNNYEDAIVLSESGAKRLVAEQMYSNKLDPEAGEASKDKHRAIFPGVFNKEQLDKIGDNGVAKPGVLLHKGDPVILAVRKRDDKGSGMGKSNSARRYADATVLWEHDAPGFVTDSAFGPKGAFVATQVENPIHVGDKMAGRFGDKHIVSAIVPDHLMPVGEDGKPFDAMVNPLGIISRGNPAQLIEAALGRVARKTGKPANLYPFSRDDFTEQTLEILRQHGLKPTEDITDPVFNRKIRGVSTGDRFYMRLHHLAEGKLSGRSESGPHTGEGTPAKGGGESAPRLGLMEVNALLSAGATNVLDDSHNVRSGKNEDYWRAVRMGFAPPPPKANAQTNKFLALLAASGIHVNQEGSRLNIMAMTDDQVDELAAGEVTKADTVRFPSLDPINGGLFDRGITGGHGGDRFSKIELGMKIPNPVMEEPIRRVLGLTEKEMREVLAGREQLNGSTGPQAIHKALARIDVKQEVEAAKQRIKTARRTPRDAAIKKLRVLEMFERTGLKPADMMISKLPVLPPNFRPITLGKGDLPMVNASNMLYKDLLQAKENLVDLRERLGDNEAGDEILAVYDAAKAVVGLGDPINKETQQRKARGLLEVVFGDSPKMGLFQRKLMGTTVNLGGRAVITPNPRLNMDQVGLPERVAWRAYQPFVMRRLVRRGLSPIEAAREIKNRSPRAREELVGEMGDRPVMINRAPSLHRFSMMGAFPVLTKHDSLQISPVVTSSFNADFDGDTMGVHVPASDAARREVIEKLMPSKQLLNLKHFTAQHLPRQEYQLGLWAATKPSKKLNPKRFTQLEEAVTAFKRGELELDDIVEVDGVAPKPQLIDAVTQGLLS